MLGKIHDKKFSQYSKSDMDRNNETQKNYTSQQQTVLNSPFFSKE